MNQLNHNAVVQIFSQAAPFNWLEPYKTRNHMSLVGSGFFINEQGFLITNYHVIAEAASILIQIPALGKEQLDVTIVGVCPERDVALLKVTPETLAKVKAQIGTLEYLTLGDSDSITRNEEIYTLGYPLGQDSLKITQGIISGRQDFMGESFLQTTAALNPGNSGGPSLTHDNKVIGINAAIIPDAQSVGYIIPISDVKTIINDLFKVKLLQRPILGCEVNYGTPDMLNYFGNPPPGGLYIARVFKGTLFDQIGVQEGDMLYSINNCNLDFYGETNVSWSEDKVSLMTVIDRLSVGQTIPIVFYRKGTKIETTFAFNHSALPATRYMFPDFETIDYEVFGGLIAMNLSLNHMAHFENLDPFLAQYQQRQFQFSQEIIVTCVFPNTQIHKTRTIYQGDLIDEVNGMKILSLDDYRNALQKSGPFITIKTKTKKFAVISREKVLAEEEVLCKEYHYEPSKLLSCLRKS